MAELEWWSDGSREDGRNDHEICGILSAMWQWRNFQTRCHHPASRVAERAFYFSTNGDISVILNTRPRGKMLR